MMTTIKLLLTFNTLLLTVFLSPVFSANPLSTPTPIACGSFFRLTDVKTLEIIKTRGTNKYDLVYQLQDTEGAIPSWGHIFDTENRFNDKQIGEGDIRLRSFVHRGFSTQTGDILLITYDEEFWKRIYLPPMTGYTELYVCGDGSTYYDENLYQLAQAALPPTPSPTPTPEGYRTPTPAPTVTTTPCCTHTQTPVPGCPKIEPDSIILTDQNRTETVTYDFYYRHWRDPSIINDWWTSAADWLEVNPSQGFGFDGQHFQVTISLGNTSSLSPGTHTAWVNFSDNFPCDPTSLSVTYYKLTPSPTPSINPTPTPSPSLAPTPKIIILKSGDYNGDGTSDIAIFRESAGLWALRDVSRLYFGRSGDIPISGDYDGDGTTDVAVFRASAGLWAIRSVSRAYLGIASDIPVPGDYDGDGYCDISVFRAGAGLWHIPGISRFYFGGIGDVPVPGDYNGDMVDDIAIFRGSSGLWAIRDISRIYFGASNDQPAPGDYDGTGSWTPAIFRPLSGLWAIRGITRVYFGAGSDFPVSADYYGIGMDTIGIFRSRSGLWAIRGNTRVYFGSGNDLPVTR